MLAVVIGERRWVARGGTRGVVTDIATIAVPFGIVGARVYHVVTSPQAYLDDPVSALYVWQGGLGIPGGIAGGFLAGVGRRRSGAGSRRAPSPTPSRRAWPSRRPSDGSATGSTRSCSAGRRRCRGGSRSTPTTPTRSPGAEAYHPTFLYELLWNLGVAGVVLWADRRWRLGGGRAFALYLALYAVGRFWIEGLRIDDANSFAGLRLNEWVMGVVLLGSVTFLWLRRGAGREEHVEPVEELEDERPREDA